MNGKDFNEILARRIQEIGRVLDSKAQEYAIGDRLYNFKRAASILRITPGRALLGMFIKHLVSVMDLVDGSIPNTKAMRDEKIGDAINYLILLEAILTEEATGGEAIKTGKE
jgi:hypothetical protein